MTLRDGCSRRRFLKRVGLTAGTALLSGGLGDRWLPNARAGEAAAQDSSASVLSEEQLEPILADLVTELDRRSAYASALYVETEGLSVAADLHGRNVRPQARSAGVVFQVHDGERFHEAATDRVDADSLRRLVRQLEREIPASARDRPGPDPGSPLVAARNSPMEVDPATVPLADWSARVDGVVERLVALDSRIRSIEVSVERHLRRTLFVNRTRRLRQSLTHSGIRIFVFASDQGQRGFSGIRRRELAGFEISNLEDGDFQKMGEILEDTLRSERIPGGTYNVISAPPVTGLLAHESFGHGVEYDQFIKGRARAAHFLGKRIAPEWVQIWDDPSQPRANGSYYFDDEGWESTPTQIVKDGVFIQPLTDLFSASAGGARRTANGRRQTYSHKAYARMSNTFFGKGETPVDEMIAGLEDGVFLDGFLSGMEDPHGWGIQFTCQRGYEIKRGKRTGRVFSPVGVTGYVPDIFASITQVGDQFALVPGTCGKGYKEFVPVASGGAHLAFRAPLS